MGRQPFVVYPNPDVPVAEQVCFFTAQAVSPGVSAGEVLDVADRADRCVYGALAVVELWLIVRFVRRGVTTGDGAPTPGTRPRARRTTTARRPRRDDDVLSFAY